MNTINPTRQLVLICLFLILATFEGQTRTLAFWSFNSAPDTSWPEQIEDDSGSVLLTHSFTKTQSYDGTTINASEGMEAGQSFCPQGGTKTEKITVRGLPSLFLRLRRIAFPTYNFTTSTQRDWRMM